MEIDERLGAALRKRRQAQGWSLSYLGEVAGTSGANISKIERGQAKEYSLALLTRLAAAFGVKLYQLIAEVEAVEIAGEAVAPAEGLLLDAFRSMSDAQRETLVAVATTLRPPR